MRTVLTVSLIVVGMGCFAYWFMFMSWSHNYAAPAFQHTQTLLLGLGTASLLAGAIIGVRTLARRKPKRRDDRENEEEFYCSKKCRETD